MIISDSEFQVREVPLFKTTGEDLGPPVFQIFVYNYTKKTTKKNANLMIVFSKNGGNFDIQGLLIGIAFCEQYLP